MTNAFLFLPILHNNQQPTTTTTTTNNNNNKKMNLNITKYAGVMAFYAVLTYILFPAIAYFLFGKTLEAVGNGFIVGSVVSVVLWKVYGFGLVKG